MRIPAVLLLALVANQAFGSAAIMEAWTSVLLKSDRIAVEARVDPKPMQLVRLTLTLNGQTVSVPEEKLRGIVGFASQTLDLEWGCGQATWTHPELDGIGIFCQNISAKFDDGPDRKPEWYEPPTVIFSFSDGKFIERRINRKKTADNSWAEGVE